MAKPKGSIRRRIQFFTTELVVPQQNEAPAANQADHWGRIAALPYESGQGLKGKVRAITDELNEVVEVAKHKDGTYYYGRMYRTRYNDYPLVGKGEIDKPLSDRLDDDEGLRHPAHFMWWDLSEKREVRGIPARRVGVLGMELNIAGPRASSLRDYVKDRCDGELLLHVDPIIDPEAWEQLAQERYVRRISASVPYTDDILAPKGNMAGLDVPRRLGNVKRFEWTIKPKKRGLFEIEPVLPRLKEFVTSEADVKLVVETLEGHLVDVTESRVTGTAYVQKMGRNAKSVSAVHMYEEIRNAYAKLGPRIARGLGRHDE